MPLDHQPGTGLAARRHLEPDGAPLDWAILQVVLQVFDLERCAQRFHCHGQLDDHLKVVPLPAKDIMSFHLDLHI